MRCMLEIAALYFLLLSIASTYVVSVAGYKVSISVKPLRVVSFNIIIVCPQHETIYHESERTKKKERGGGSVSRYFHAIPQSQHTHPFQKTHNISLKRIYGSGSGCTPRNSFFRIVAFFAVGRASTSYRRGGCREGKQEITESKCSKELKKKKKKKRVDLFREIRATTM